MSPNLFLCLKSVGDWIPEKPFDERYEFHYQSEPVPGIYLILPTTRYLIAVKPQGANDGGCLFKNRIGLTEPERRIYKPQNSMERSPIDYTWSVDEGESCWVTAATCTTGTIRSTSAASPSSPAITDGSNSSNSSGASSRRTVKFVVPAPRQESNPYRAAPRPVLKSPLSQLISADDLPSPPPPREPLAQPKGWLFPKRRQEKTNKIRLRDIDFIGYRPVSYPLEVEYSFIFQRWMFTTELSRRTHIFDTCASDDCMDAVVGRCNSGVLKKEFTCLDDGHSWILTGDVIRKGRKPSKGAPKVKRRPHIDRDTNPLYCLNGAAKMRRQTEEETIASRKNLWEEEGKILRWAGKDDDYLTIRLYFPRMQLGKLWS